MQNTYIAFIIGRTPALAQKEIEAKATILPFRWSLSMVQPDVVLLKPLVDVDEHDFEKEGSLSHYFQKLQDCLGGTLKIVVLTVTSGSADLQPTIENFIKKCASQKTGTLDFGLSIHGKGFEAGRMGKGIKGKLRNNGTPVRFVEPKEGNGLSTAQVFHNRLSMLPRGKGVEVMVVQQGSEWLIGKTVTVQDIGSYRKRDFDIPSPDAVSGMLTPKLAQAMINIAVGNQDLAVYDAFCGNGRIVTEALLMGLKAYGSDIVETKVTSSHENIEWTAVEYNLELEKPVAELVWKQDATLPEAVVKTAKAVGDKPFCIVSEPYLGKPLRAPLSPAEVGPWIAELDELYSKFFAVWAKAAIKPEHFIMVFPAARLQSGGYVSVLDSQVDRLGEMGYICSQVSDYGRPDAFVKRHIVRVTYTN